MSGTLAGYYSENHEVAYFGTLGAIAIILGLALLAISSPVRRLMGNVR
jgi:POT family proton-dependent oligopeptide transporter